MDHVGAMRAKILSREELLQRAQEWRAAGKKIAFTNGCFDLLHPGHAQYLASAASLGDILVVGLNTDDSVRRLGKGASRPIQNQDSRALILSALSCVGAVVLFDEDTPLQLIEALRPDILVKGSDYMLDTIVGRDVVESYGGLVTTVELIPGHSTTALERKILAAAAQ